MFEIILTACLVSGDVCATRLMPVSISTESDCGAALPEATRDWAERHGSLRVQEAICVHHSNLGDDIAPLRVQEIASGVFMHRGQHAIPAPRNAGDLANLGFVIGKKGIAVIDAGGSRSVAERLYVAIRERSDLPIQWLLITHMHPDHSLGASVFAEAGAKVAGHPNLELALANRAQSYETALERLLGPEAYLGTRLIGRNTPVPDRLDLGGRVLDIQTYQIAHTDNDLTIYDRETSTLFAGDLVFAEHTPALDGSILGWQTVLETLSEIEAAQVVPGHGPVLRNWPTGAQPIHGYLSTLTAETRAAIAAGEPMSSAIDHLGESQRGQWQLFDEFNKRNATAAYKELEWE